MLEIVFYNSLHQNMKIQKQNVCQRLKSRNPEKIKQKLRTKMKWCITFLWLYDAQIAIKISYVIEEPIATRIPSDISRDQITYPVQNLEV